MTGLHADAVAVRLADRPVLEGVSLDVRPAEVVGLLAPSGAGKSTLLRALVRLIEADAGTITLNGDDIRTLDACALRRRVGLVAQTPAMLEGTVSDNLAHGLAALSEADAIVALEAAGLPPEMAGRDARHLSGGERARVGLARALTREPELLLLDEPTAALDGDATQRVGATLRRLAQDGIGICVATHDLEFARAYTDRQVELG